MVSTIEINCLFFRGHLTKITNNNRQQKQDIKDFSFHTRWSDGTVYHCMKEEWGHEERG